MVQGLIAMKPRQVLLSCSSAKALSGGRPLSLTAEQRPLLLQAICDFLESNGFSKTLKKFLSEASLERDSSKNCILNLEHACCMYLDARLQNEADENNISSDKGPEKIIDDDANVKSKEKKNKKSGKDSSTQNGEVHSIESEVASADAVRDEKSSKKAKDKKKKKGSEPAAEPVNEKAKDKKKKKGSEPADESVKEKLQSSCVENGTKESTEAEKSMKSKSERKKNKGGKIDDAEDKGLGSKEGLGEGAEQNKKKSSKKRKKSSSEEDKSDDIGAAPEDSKRRKTAGSDDNLGSQLKNGQMDSQTPASVIGKHSEMLAEDDAEDKSALKKSSAKKQNGSTEPRTQNAFQRVKADEVEFADEKLQDNSYWAKDGAEVGYGAKAQEVLGQVRGRDFRHEKTKKKRGSYRGGLIDLQSHSVKFNYSDNDE